MKACCGEENDDSARHRHGCGCEFSQLTPSTLEASPPKPVRPLFRWIPTAIILWVIGLISGLVAVADLWLAVLAVRGTIHDASIGDSQHMVRLLLRGVFENAAIGSLCLFSWYLMRRQTRTRLLAGTAAGMFALFITLRRWTIWEIREDNPLGWVEPLLIWPCLIYTIIYAYRASTRASKVSA